MTDDPYFSIGPARPIAGVAAPDAMARGDGWRVERQSDGLWLFYISGEQGGRERAILIDEAAADALAAGERTLDDVLIARGAS